MKVQIIAELAQGFEGNPDQAKLLLRAALNSGASAAKFQLIIADELATPDYKYYNLFRSLEMPEDIWSDLFSYAVKSNIELHLDIFGARSLNLAQKIGVEAIKLHATDITNIDLIDQIARSSIKKIIIGAGGSHIEEIDEVVSRLTSKNILILLGFQGYPTPNEANQINRIHLFCERYKKYKNRVQIGFSDHAPPDSPLKYAIPVAAIGAGAVALEKHLTLGRVMKLEDHESALNPDEFETFAKIVRDCAAALGDKNDFGITESEKTYRKNIRRHVVACRDIPQGTILLPQDLTLKRTSAENPISDLGLVYQRIALTNIDKNQPIFQKNIS